MLGHRSADGRVLRQEIGQQPSALLREHRLGMELNALGGQLAVAHGHHDAVAAGAALQNVGKVGLGNERVVAPHLQGGRQSAEDRPAVMLDSGRLAVDRVVGDDAPPPRLHQRLMAEAHAQGGDPGLGEAAHRLQRDAGLVRRAGPG
jgi:hypothetical protein